MNIDDLPDNAIIAGGDPGDYPPWDAARQDGELQALRFAFCQLAQGLHRAGVLDLAVLRAGLGDGEVWFRDQPETLRSSRWIEQTLAYTLKKSGPFRPRR
ncbi:MAG: hypothetical protein IPN92_07110 [Chromatiaceae bacterium]|nr:hypothetical protein [Chromatiaceae bacterium]